MSCHTWGYLKVSALDDTLKQKFVNKKIKDIESYWYLSESKEEVIKYMQGVYKTLKGKSYTEEDYDNDIRRCQDNIKNLKERGFDFLIELEGNSAKVIEYNDELYWNITFDEPFRLQGYCEKHFTDRTELLKFLKDHENDLSYYTEIGFEHGYTEELENKVRDFFERYGEDNLYFQFG